VIKAEGRGARIEHEDRFALGDLDDPRHPERHRVTVRLDWDPEGFAMWFDGATFGEARAEAVATLVELSRAARKLRAR
jgi:hypothetical protein